jgi:hypothetical protein
MKRRVVKLNRKWRDRGWGLRKQPTQQEEDREPSPYVRTFMIGELVNPVRKFCPLCEEMKIRHQFTMSDGDELADICLDCWRTQNETESFR